MAHVRGCPGWLEARWGVALVVAAALSMLAIAARAGEVDRDGQAATLLADQLVIQAHASLGGDGRPRADEFERARVLLGLALQLRDNDSELWRLSAELAEHMDDAPALRESWSRYVRLQPADDVGQLALIRARLGALRTLDAQLDRLEAILEAPQVRSFSLPLRSRLATDAAKIARELGRTDVVGRWLAHAVSLDAANPDAAAMFYALALERGGMSRIALAAIHRVAAAPADADARVELADVLLSQALYRPATEQYAMAQQLAHRPLSADMFADWALALSALGEDEAALGLLSQLQPEPSDDADRLGIELELRRLATLVSARVPRDDAIRQSYDRLVQRLQQRIASAKRDGEVQRAARIEAELAWVRLLFDRDVDEAAASIEQLEARDDTAAYLVRLRAWLALRRGEHDAARRAFTEQSANDPFAAMGLAQLTEDSARRAALKTQTLHRAADSLAGLLAARMLRAAGERIAPTELGGSLERLMARHPSHLWRPALSIAPWVEFEIHPDRSRLAYLEPVGATIYLRNTSQISLPMADGRGAPTRVLVSLAPRVDGERAAAPPPIVVDVRRRLTLEPGESLAIDVRLDRGPVGSMLAQLPHRDLRIEGRAILDPRGTDDDGFTAGPIGAVVRLPAIEVGKAIPDDDTQALEGALAALEAPDLAERMRAIAVLTRAFENLPPALDDAATRARITESVNAATNDFDEIGKAWVARFLPRDPEARAAFGEALERIEASDSPLVRIVHLASHADAPDDALLINSLDHDVALVRDFASALRIGLEARKAE